MRAKPAVAAALVRALVATWLTDQLNRALSNPQQRLSAMLDAGIDDDLWDDNGYHNANCSYTELLRVAGWPT
ncbi:MAG: hypothetical protein EOM24_03020 [Chloroflexia bacterium]|nr:hypothetical protein [Chloroflexia bacterium]